LLAGETAARTIRNFFAILIRMLGRLAPGRVALVTDAMAAAGRGDGRCRLGNRDVDVAAGGRG
jgi:N-acetylglucosamine-6-phosphate deacetylase